MRQFYQEKDLISAEVQNVMVRPPTHPPTHLGGLWEGRGRKGGSNALLYALIGWVGGWEDVLQLRQFYQEKDLISAEVQNVMVGR